MAAIGGNSGPTLYMTVAAKDNTKEALDRASSNINIYANNVSVAMQRANVAIGNTSEKLNGISTASGNVSENVSRDVDKASKELEKLGTTSLTTMNRVGSLAMRLGTLGAVTGLLSNEQAKAIGVFGTAMSTMATMASVVKALTAIEWAHVAALTWKVSLMTLGIGVAIAAAAAMAVLAMQTQKAADSQKSYNTELEKGSNLQSRRTSNQKIVSRSGYTEIID
jgi:hypothetical protein